MTKVLMSSDAIVHEISSITIYEAHKIKYIK